jgi:hypothetical protein
VPDSVYGSCQILGFLEYGSGGIDKRWAMGYNLGEKEANMDMDEWYNEKVLKPKQEWARVSKEAKLTKLRNKMSKRDIEREVRIEALGGKSIEVLYGVPLKEEVRKDRLELEWDLKYPKRKEKKAPVKRMPKGFKQTKGKKRTKEQFLYQVLMGAKSRAKSKGVPFDITVQDVVIPDVCPVLGIPLKWGDRLTHNTPTVDRVVPELGYVKGNCKVISMKANRLKNNASEEELKAILEYITKNRLVVEPCEQGECKPE